MAEYEGQRFESDANLQIAQFGLTEGFIESLSPEDLKGLLGQIAKFALRTRHPDRFGSRVDYSFGNTDARSLTAFAGGLARKSNDEISELQRGFSEEAVVKEYREHAIDLARQVDELQESLHSTQVAALESLVPWGEFDGTTLISRIDDTSPNMALLVVGDGGKVKQAKGIKPIDKVFVKDSEQWAQQAYHAGQRELGLDITEPFTSTIVKSGNSIKIKIGNDFVDLADLGVDTSEAINTSPRAGKVLPIQLYTFSPSINRRTGKFGQQLFVTYSKPQGSYALSSHPNLIGFGNSEWLWDEDSRAETEQIVSLVNKVPLGLPAPKWQPEQKVFKHITPAQFWSHYQIQKEDFKRSHDVSAGYAPILFDSFTKTPECIALGPFQGAVRIEQSLGNKH